MNTRLTKHVRLYKKGRSRKARLILYSVEKVISTSMEQGIGVNDMFVMIASWRTTDIRAPVEERMSETMAEAALSITITSTTDTLALAVGVLTKFPSVQIFCAYTGLAAFFNYFYQLTFFAACMAISGKRESGNRHYGTCLRVRPKDESSSKLYAICCSGGPSRKNNESSRQESPHAFMVFFRDFFGPFLTHAITKVVVITTYLAYIGVSIWGILNLQEGMQLKNLASDHSYVKPFYELEERYFEKYGPAVFVIFPEELNTLEPEDNQNFLSILEDFEESEFTYSKNLTDCWLRSFIEFLDSRNIAQDSDSSVLLTILRNEFLGNPSFQRFSLDVVFEEDEIVASRCLVTTKDINTSNRERDMMSYMRKKADQSDCDITVYHPSFVFFDQYDAILPNTVKKLGIALLSMLFVSLVLIPQPICTFWVVFCILSTEVGVVGLMSHWNINLDSISMINLILCIGFSVDFSAHITYTFTISSGTTNNERIITTLFAVGMPIVQGALSTIAGIAVLSVSDSYIFRTFFKTMFLVIIIGLFHSMFFLPVLLTLLGGSSHIEDTELGSNRNNADQNSTASHSYQNRAYEESVNGA